MLRESSPTGLLLLAILANAPVSLGQDGPPPPPPAGSQAPPQPSTAPAPTIPPPEATNPGVGLDDLAARMADRLDDFAADVATDLPVGPDAEGLARNAGELAQAVRDFRAGLARRPDAFAVRRSFSGIDAGWNGLTGELAGIPKVPASLARASKRIDQVEAQIRQAVGLNPTAATFYNANAAPAGPADVVRLAAALADRSSALASVVHENAPTLPGGLVLASDVDNLAREADSFHDSIGVDPRAEVAARAYQPVKALSDRIAASIRSIPNPPAPLSSAWSSYASAQSLLEQNLSAVSPNPAIAPAPAPAPGLAPAPGVVVGTAMPARGFQLNVPGANIRVGGLGGVQVNAPGVNIATPGVAPGGIAPPSTVQAQADLLVGQVNEFLAVWGPTAGVVPLGGLMLSDARQLQAAAIDFQRDVARGLDPGRLAFEFRSVDLIWQRLARRVNRVAQGRVGPNIAQVYRIGDTVSQIHNTLGLPGYPAVVQQFP